MTSLLKMWKSIRLRDRILLALMFFLGVIVPLLWCVGKLTGIIQTPLWVEIIPFYGNLGSAGLATLFLLFVLYDNLRLHKTNSKLDGKIGDIESDLKQMWGVIRTLEKEQHEIRKEMLTYHMELISAIHSIDKRQAAMERK